MDLRGMRPCDAPAAAVLLAPSMAWSPLLVQSTFDLGRPVVSEVMTDGAEVVGVVHLVGGVPGVPDDVLMLRLAVAEASRGRGFGRMLWRRVLDELPVGAAVAARVSADDGVLAGVEARAGDTEDPTEPLDAAGVTMIGDESEAADRIVSWAK